MAATCVSPPHVLFCFTLGLIWHHDDRRLVSVGAGGACYTWDMGTLARVREAEFVDKTALYHGVGLTSRGALTICRTAAGKLHVLHSGQLRSEVRWLALRAAGNWYIVHRCKSVGKLL